MGHLLFWPFVVLVGMASLACFIVVLVKMFQADQVGLGVTCIVLALCTGIGYLIAFIVGWIKAGEWNIKKVMWAWTGLFLLYLVAAGWYFVYVAGQVKGAVEQFGAELEARSKAAKANVDLAAATPDLTVDAETWAADWKKDRAAAKQKYGGKVVVISGEVGNVDADPYDRVGYVYLKAAGSDLGARCMTTDKEPWAKVSPGSKVKIKGKGGDSDDLYPCVIAEAGPNPATALSAPQLAKEYLANPEATKAKYDKKWLRIDGIIVDKDANKAGAASVRLKGEGKVKVDCRFTAGEEKLTAGLKEGQHLKALAQFAAFMCTPDMVVLLFALPIKEATFVATAPGLEAKELGSAPLPGGTRPGAAASKPSDAVAVSAEQLTKDYATDEEAAQTKYRGKILEVEGLLDDNSVKSSGDVTFLVKGYTPPQKIGWAVSCMANKDSRTKPAVLTKGQKVKVRGSVVTAITPIVMLGDCEIVLTGPDPAIRLSAAQLATAYAKDRGAADTKYKGKQLLLEGVVQKLEKKKFLTEVLFVYLEGADSVRVEVEPRHELDGEFAKFQKGQTLKVKGECTGIPFADLAGASAEVKHTIAIERAVVVP